MANEDGPVLDYSSKPLVAQSSNSGISDGYWSLLLSLTSLLSFALSIFAILWFVAIIYYGWSAVRKTHGRSVPGWIGLVYGSGVVIAAMCALGWMLYTGK